MDWGGVGASMSWPVELQHHIFMPPWLLGRPHLKVPTVGLPVSMLQIVVKV